MKFNKGQAGNNLVSGLIVLMLVGFLGIVSITIFDSIQTSTTNAAQTTRATQTVSNITDSFYEGMELSSNIPIVLSAGLLLAVIVGFALYVRA